MTKENKTLNDLKIDCTCKDYKQGWNHCLDELKAFVVNWIKEDIENYRHSEILNGLEPEQGRKVHNFIVQQRQKWKDRLDIKEGDLK